MASTAPRTRRAYPSKTVIGKMITIARELGLDVAGFAAAPDGTVSVMEARAMPKPAAGGESEESLFDQLEREGRL